MEIREKQTGNILTDWEFKYKFPDTSFPDMLNEQILNDFGFDVVFEGPQLTPANVYQYSQRSGVEEINGKWFTKYISGPLFVSNEQGSAQVQEDAYKAAMDAVQASKQRLARAQMLKDSDWTQVADAPVDQAAWRTYRQELRDITIQEGFPWSINWPVEP